MAKPLFKNYTFEFDKNEKKMLNNFVRQALKQIEGDPKYAGEVRIFSSLSEKLNSAGPVKLTKDEKTRLTMQLRENLKHIEAHMKKGWFLKRWLYKSMYTQYKNIYQTHFEE